MIRSKVMVKRGAQLRKKNGCTIWLLLMTSDIVEIKGAVLETGF